MSSQEVSEYLGINIHTLRGWVKRDVIEAVKKGRKLCFDRDYVAAFKRSDPSLIRPRPFYSPQVLAHYRDSPDKYEMTQDGSIHWIRLRADYIQALSPEERNREYFDPIRYLMTKAPPTGEPAILISPLVIKNLPPVEQDHWSQHEL